MANTAGRWSAGGMGAHTSGVLDQLPVRSNSGRCRDSVGVRGSTDRLGKRGGACLDAGLALVSRVGGHSRNLNSNNDYLNCPINERLQPLPQGRGPHSSFLRLINQALSCHRTQPPIASCQTRPQN